LLNFLFGRFFCHSGDPCWGVESAHHGLPGTI
jgi:hypothetical protein